VSCLVSERLRRRGDSSVAAHRRHPGGSPSKHGAGAAPDDDVRWSPLVEAEERRCGDVAGMASTAWRGRRTASRLRAQGSQTPRRVRQRPVRRRRRRSSDGFAVAGTGVAGALSRPAEQRLGEVVRSGGFAVAGAGVAGVASRPTAARRWLLGEVLQRRFLGARRPGSWASCRSCGGSLVFVAHAVVGVGAAAAAADAGPATLGTYGGWV